MSDLADSTEHAEFLFIPPELYHQRFKCLIPYRCPVRMQGSPGNCSQEFLLETFIKITSGLISKGFLISMSKNG